jgi:CheY-like chemotaxis protein/LmbE family N-acetylglucosaminyl deacetylase
MSEGTEKKAQVLLVEDSLTDATLIRTILEREGDIRVTLAQDGIRGCQLVESHRWDLVITDFNLPGRDGIEVILTCKAKQPDTPIISTSAYSASVYRDGAIRGGASEVLTKPIDAPELIRTVRDLLQLKQKADSQAKVVLAIGAFPGDAEAGCGGALMKHALAGDQAHVLVLSAGGSGSDGEEGLAAAGRACRVMGATVHLPPEDVTGVPDLDAALLRIKDAVEKLNPDVVFAPSMNDVRESRKHAHTATEISVAETTSLLCYQAATTTLEFRPTVFEDISDFLDQKMAALSHFLSQVKSRPHLDPGLARAAARYWGRFLGYGEVEPFEITRHSL